MLLLAAIIFLLCASFVVSIRSSQKPARFSSGRQSLFDLRILIHGTRNAYTTLRNFDVIFFTETTTIPNETRLGVYTSDGLVRPLCTFDSEEVTNKFHVDPYETALPAEQLKAENRILRIVSSDRIGDSAFTIDEYLGNDVVIPIRSRPTISPVDNSDSKESNPVSSRETENVPSSTNSLDSDIEILKLEIELKQLQLKLLKFEKEKKNQNLVARNYVFTPSAPQPVGPYTQAIVSKGLVYASGCIGLDPKTGKLVEGGVEVEARRSFINLNEILKASGSDLRDVLKLTILLQDLKDFAAVNKICTELWTNGRYPSRTTFQVAALPLGARIEVDAIAEVSS